MAFIQRLNFYVPTPMLGFLMILAFVSFTVVGLIVVRKFVHHNKLKVHNDVASAIFGTLGVAYTVMLAFVVVIAWQGFDTSSLNVEKEANCLVSLYRDSGAFQKPFGEEMRSLMREYVEVLITKEWKLLARGQGSIEAYNLLKKIWIGYTSYEPKSENEKIFFAESVRKLNEMGELRRLRLIDSKTGIHPVLYFVLIAGGLITIVFTLFFGTENFRAQMIMSSMLAAIIAMILFTVLSLDFPFTGGLNITSDAFKVIVHF